MRTAIIIAMGLGLLATFIAVARWFGSNAATATAAAIKAFISLWFFAAATNLWIGVSQAGYSVLDELPIFLVIFGLPAGIGLLFHWKQT